MKASFAFLFLFIFCSGTFAQKRISSNERTILLEDLSTDIQTLNRFVYDNPESIPVYRLQLLEIEKNMQKYKEYTFDPQIFERWNDLNSYYTQSKEIVDFLTSRSVLWLYHKAYSSLIQGKKEAAYTLFMKLVQVEPRHVMGHYQLAKMKIDEGKLAQGMLQLCKIIKEMKPTEIEKSLVYNLASEKYNLNYLNALSLSKQGKHADALDVLQQLDTFCQADPMYICNSSLLAKTITQSKQGIYADHVKIAQKAVKQNNSQVASDFVVWAYEYFDEHRDEIKDTMPFVELAKTIALKYVEDAKAMSGSNKLLLQEEYIEKAKFLSALTDDNFRKEINQLTSGILPAKTGFAQKAEDIEKEAKEESISEKYSDFAISTEEVNEQDIDRIEKDYIREASKQNRAGNTRETKSMKKELEEKFFETRSFLSVNSFEKALEVLNSANKLAQIKTEKEEVEEMYRRAIREITAKRMSDAEYLIWQGQQKSADSLIELTNELITNYKMKNDTAIIRIMNSYLGVLDKKVCQKKQDEINVYVFNIMDCIKKYEYHKAAANVKAALAVPASNQCTLDKSKVKSLMKQIEMPLEYVNLLDKAYYTLQGGDTVGYIQMYGELEDIFYMNNLGDRGIQHLPMKQIVISNGDVNFALKVVEVMLRHKHYMVALESLNALKGMGYKSSDTKKIQERIAKQMAIEMDRMNYTSKESIEIVGKYINDKWYKYFSKTFKKQVKDLEKRAQLKG